MFYLPIERLLKLLMPSDRTSGIPTFQESRVRQGSPVLLEAVHESCQMFHPLVQALIQMKHVPRMVGTRPLRYCR